MGNPLAERPGAAGRSPCRLLLALTLALAACGGGGDEKAKGGDTPADTAAVVRTAMATDTCTGPPPAFKQAVFQGTWQALLDSLTAHAITFPDIGGNDDTASVKLCNSKDCMPISMEIRSSNLTPCLRPDSLTGESRILGLFILLQDFPGAQGWDPIPAGDTIFTFAHQRGGPARLAYRHGENIKTSPLTAWAFAYCEDGHVGSKVPMAQWRDRGATATTAPGAGKEEEEEEAGEDSKYGWMACASGCCQFYSNPPGPITTPQVANPHAPNVVGGGPPRWCRIVPP